jgi:hypothetical protein
MFLHAFTHDLSKFNPVEFIPYAKYFYGLKTNHNKFNLAWLHHQHKNKHHWNFWVHGDGQVEEMPLKYVKQMLCDWLAMSIQMQNDLRQWYNKNRILMTLHPETIIKIENLLYDENSIFYY